MRRRIASGVGATDRHINETAPPYDETRPAPIEIGPVTSVTGPATFATERRIGATWPPTNETRWPMNVTASLTNETWQQTFAT